THPKSKKTSAFGMFSVNIDDGAINWMRPSVVRVYPSGSPGHAPVVRPVDQRGAYGGFARLDAGNGRVVGQITAADVPGSGWWLAFPGGMDKLGFLKHGHPGTAFDLVSGKPVAVEEQRGWSFCVTDPKPLPLSGQAPGFYSTAALCEYDLASGKRVADAGAPPVWYTGSQQGPRRLRASGGRPVGPAPSGQRRALPPVWGPRCRGEKYWNIVLVLPTKEGPCLRPSSSLPPARPSGAPSRDRSRICAPTT